MFLCGMFQCKILSLNLGFGAQYHTQCSFGRWIKTRLNLSCLIWGFSAAEWGLKTIGPITRCRREGYSCFIGDACALVCIRIPAGKYLFVLFFVWLYPPFITYKSTDLVCRFGPLCFVFVCLICLVHRKDLSLCVVSLFLCKSLASLFHFHCFC